MNDINKMTDAEVRAAFEKLQADREKQKQRSREYLARPEVKARSKQYAEDRKNKLAAIIARAKELGLEL